MKKSMFIGLLTLTFIFQSFSQISGGFYRSQNGSVYFSGKNTSQYTLTINVVAVNEQLNQQRSWQYTINPSRIFIIDESYGWQWQTGEKLYVQFANGQSIYWVNNISQAYSPSFRGREGEHCTGDMHGCPCPGYEKYSNADWHCKYCGHPKSYHKF